MNRLWLLPLLCAAGCSMFSGSTPTESEAARIMILADSLERASFLREAALEYTIAAEQYPEAPGYPTAVRRAALLYLNPSNPSRSDSASLHWLEVYVTIPVSREEKENARALIGQLQRIVTLRAGIARQMSIADSLGGVARKQATLVTSQLHRIQELEAELTQANQELKRIKEIDLKLSRSRGRK